MTTPPPADPRIADLLEAIAATIPGNTTTWTSRGIEVTVYGQRRYELPPPPGPSSPSQDESAPSTPGNNSSTTSTRSPQVVVPYDHS